VEFDDGTSFKKDFELARGDDDSCCGGGLYLVNEPSPIEIRKPRGEKDAGVD
jgi:hypothetical protein